VDATGSLWVRQTLLHGDRAVAVPEGVDGERGFELSNTQTSSRLVRVWLDTQANLAAAVDAPLDVSEVVLPSLGEEVAGVGVIGRSALAPGLAVTGSPGLGCIVEAPDRTLHWALPWLSEYWVPGPGIRTEPIGTAALPELVPGSYPTVGVAHAVSFMGEAFEHNVLFAVTYDDDDLDNDAGSPPEALLGRMEGDLFTGFGSLQTCSGRLAGGHAGPCDGLTADLRFDGAGHVPSAPLATPAPRPVAAEEFALPKPRLSALGVGRPLRPSDRDVCSVMPPEARPPWCDGIPEQMVWERDGAVFHMQEASLPSIMIALQRLVVDRPPGLPPRTRVEPVSLVDLQDAMYAALPENPPLGTPRRSTVVVRVFMAGPGRAIESAVPSAVRSALTSETASLIRRSLSAWPWWRIVRIAIPSSSAW
jgi:hypothetical protein